jgi:LmbE family N-acetylglucosaminyl deacetylase
VREQELHESCRRLGAQHAVCLDYGDGTLKDLDINILIEHVVNIIRTFKPDVVITFGPDGAYGHPDHIAIGTATTVACAVAGSPQAFPTQISASLQAHAPACLYHSHFPRSRMLMLETLSRWLVNRKSQNGATGQVDPTEFVRALLLFTEEATLLNYSSDRIDVNWYPSGFYIIEQGEVAKDLYLILSGNAQAVLEHDDGTMEKLSDLGPGYFFGELALARNHRRLAHVIARDNVTCLVLSMTEAAGYAGRGGSATLTGADRTGDSTAGMFEERQNFTHGIDVSDYVQQKVAAMAAHRTQYPISPEMFPPEMLIEMMGREFFVRVLPRPKVETVLFPDEAC